LAAVASPPSLPHVDGWTGREPAQRKEDEVDATAKEARASTAPRPAHAPYEDDPSYERCHWRKQIVFKQTRFNIAFPKQKQQKATIRLGWIN
jgi:hypothetical protein